MKEEIEKLQNGGVFIEDQGCEVYLKVHRLYEYYIVFTTPLFGGPEIFQGTWKVNQLDKMLTSIEHWT